MQNCSFARTVSVLKTRSRDDHMTSSCFLSTEAGWDIWESQAGGCSLSEIQGLFSLGVVMEPFRAGALRFALGSPDGAWPGGWGELK